MPGDSASPHPDPKDDSPDEIEVRDASDDELLTVARIWADEWPSPRHDLPVQAASWKSKRNSGSDIFLVAASQERIFGFCRAQAITRGRRVGEEVADVEISYLAIIPDAQRSGSGSSLVRAMVERLASTFHLAVVDVEEGRPAAFEFWKRQGWNHIYDEPKPGGTELLHVLTKNLRAAN